MTTKVFEIDALPNFLRYRAPLPSPQRAGAPLQINCLHDGCFAALISDINECTSLTHDCHSDATCTNTEGAFTCSCNQGYTGDGRQCMGMFLLGTER